MLKKSFLTIALGLTLAMGSTLPVAAQDAAPDLKEDPTEVVAEKPNGQVDLEVEGINSGEVNTVEESAPARKMTREEKAENARVNDSWGGAITLIAMIIVLGCLIILSVLFLGFGKISSKLLTKKKLQAKGISKEEAADAGHLDLVSGEVIAAIAAALNEHFAHDHDMEDTVLTIRRLRKAYSPWNSKIYNLRETPALKRNHQAGIGVQNK